MLDVPDLRSEVLDVGVEVVVEWRGEKGVGEKSGGGGAEVGE